MKHKHHIIPKHMSGTDDPENIIELTIEEHADAHKKLYEENGKIEDYLAWKGLSGQIGKEDILLEISRNNGSRMGKIAFENKIGIFAMTNEETLPFIKRGGRTSGRRNAESGHCAEIAHLGGKASYGMKFWYNQKTNEETRSFECPGEDWIKGVKMSRINIDSLRTHSNNVKGSFWIHNPDTNESKMVFSDKDIPDGFIFGRNLNIKNTVQLLNVGLGIDSNLPNIKSDYSDIRFDNSYQRWVFEFKIGDKKNKITHIDYFGLLWARDCIINYYRLDKIKSNICLNDSYSKEEMVELFKSFKEYLKIQKILEAKMKKYKKDIYSNKLLHYENNYILVSEKRLFYMKIED